MKMWRAKIPMMIECVEVNRVTSGHRIGHTVAYFENYMDASNWLINQAEDKISALGKEIRKYHEIVESILDTPAPEKEKP